MVNYFNNGNPAWEGFIHLTFSEDSDYYTIEFTFDDTWLGDGVSDYFDLDGVFTEPVCSGSSCSFIYGYPGASIPAGNTITIYFKTSSKITAVSVASESKSTTFCATSSS